MITSELLPGLALMVLLGLISGPQHRHQVVGRLEIELENLRGNLVARGQAAFVAIEHAHAGALQFGIGLGHHLVEAVRLHQGVALQAQRRHELAHGDGAAHRLVGHQGQRALDARVHHHIAPGDAGKGAGHRVDLGIVEVQRHRLSRSGSGLRHGIQRIHCYDTGQQDANRD